MNGTFRMFQKVMKCILRGIYVPNDKVKLRAFMNGLMQV
jgi:hypothetical protein